MSKKPVMLKIKTATIDDEKYVEVGSLIKYFKDQKEHYEKKKKTQIKQYNEVLINKFLKLIPKDINSFILN